MRNQLMGIYSASVIAFCTPSLARSYWVEGAASASYALFSQTSESSSPQLASFALHLAVGTEWRHTVQLGIAASYAVINQYSGIATATGNRRGGWLVPVAPVVGLRWRRLLVQSVFVFTGSYRLFESDASGQTISYQAPLGVQLSIAWQVSSRVTAGLLGEYVLFSRETAGSTSNNLASSMRLNTYGLLFAYRL